MQCGGSNATTSSDLFISQSRKEGFKKRYVFLLKLVG